MNNVALLAVAFSAAFGSAVAQDLPTTTPLPPAPAAVTTNPAAAPPAAPQLVAGTVVEVEITEPLSSKTSAQGATFALRLAKPILYDGRVVVPAGLTGQGEVIDSKRAGMGGRPGELILAARFVDDGAVRIPLRSLKFGMTGHDNGNTAMAVAAAGVVVPGAAIVSMFIQGGEVIVPAGTHANAKLKTDLALADLPPAAGEAAIAAPAAAPPALPTTPASAPASASSPSPQQGHAQ